MSPAALSDVMFFIKGMLIGSGLTLCVITWLKLRKLKKGLDEHIKQMGEGIGGYQPRASSSPINPPPRKP